MFSRFWKKGNKEHEVSENEGVSETINWSFLGADMHSHLLPGIDDGAQTMEDSMSLLRRLSEMGIKRVVTTPHTMIDFYPNTTKIITERLAAVQANLLEEEIDVHLTAASEYYIDEHFLSLIEKEPLLTIRNNEVLVEFSMVYEPPMLNTALFKIISAGYKPIIAHPERYIFFHNSFERYEELRDRGCLLQLNLLSLTGYYGKNIMMAAQRMLDSKMYAYCGTDMHHLRHADGINAMLSGKIMQHLVNYPFFNSKLCL